MFNKKISSVVVREISIIFLTFWDTVVIYYFVYFVTCLDDPIHDALIKYYMHHPGLLSLELSSTIHITRLELINSWSCHRIIMWAETLISCKTNSMCDKRVWERVGATRGRLPNFPYQTLSATQGRLLSFAFARRRWIRSVIARIDALIKSYLLWF